MRARVVYGDPQLTAHFDAVRREIMTLPREGKTLQTEVREMREKMRAHLGNKHRDRFDIKADEGGITDIEFITQYLVLRYAHETEVNALVRQRAYSGTTGAKRHYGRAGSDGADPCLHYASR